ncbi:MAG: redox-sensing transcriptional repressor Rex, partial [Phycisphaerae bacterium]|nr:redox-sensing transcriptional repressor Rex [Phycisphaerae bacterium]
NGKVGKQVGSVVVRHISELPEIVRKNRVKLAVVAVPTEAAQKITDMLCQAGVMGILNFAPTILETPAGVTVRPVDLAASLEQLSFRVAGSK